MKKNKEIWRNAASFDKDTIPEYFSDLRVLQVHDKLLKLQDSLKHNCSQDSRRFTFKTFPSFFHSFSLPFILFYFLIMSCSPSFISFFLSQLYLFSGRVTILNFPLAMADWSWKMVANTFESSKKDSSFYFFSSCAHESWSQLPWQGNLQKSFTLRDKRINLILLMKESFLLVRFYWIWICGL